MADTTHPSTAHYDRKGHYVHDPLNQTFAEHEKLGNLGARPVPQAQHPFGAPGYCAKHLRLGCEACNA